MPVQDNEKRQMTPSSTLFDKLWKEHCIQSDASGEDLLLTDRILLHERTGAVALEALREKWSSMDGVDDVLKQAARSKDPEIREAAGGSS